ncbi:putative sulfate exporter family transporter [Lacticaseibacillus parakribbianus]|uniref:putative sulfate exporter family transporter n=1 Tax=Lacticaseibacillus parakribbianus TaxID=2970927 RepID=UPI003B8455FE
MTETAVVTPATPVADASVATVGDGPVADASVATVGDEPVAAASVATVGDEPAAAGAANAHVAGATAATRPAPAKAKRRLPVPWYVLGFLILCVLNSAVTLPPVWASGAHFVSTWFETTALAAIGLRLNFGNFMRQGRRFLAYGLSVGALQTVAALALLKLLAV